MTPAPVGSRPGAAKYPCGISADCPCGRRLCTGREGCPCCDPLSGPLSDAPPADTRAEPLAGADERQTRLEQAIMDLPESEQGHWRELLAIGEKADRLYREFAAEREARRKAEAALCEAEAILDAVSRALSGDGISDFEESFPLVRLAQEQLDEVNGLRTALAEVERNATELAWAVEHLAGCGDLSIDNCAGCAWSFEYFLAHRDRIGGGK